MRKSKHSGTLAGICLAALMMVSGRAAQAYPEFPSAIQKHFGEETCPVSCLLCHTSPEGGDSTIRDRKAPTNLPPERGTALFVQNLIYVAHEAQFPLTAQDETPTEAELINAVKSLEAWPCTEGMPQPCDSDGDGMTDYAELAQGADPDRFGTIPNACPKYGCGAHIARLPADSALADIAIACSALGLALLLVRRRQSARP